MALNRKTYTLDKRTQSVVDKIATVTERVNYLDDQGLTRIQIKDCLNISYQRVTMIQEN